MAETTAHDEDVSRDEAADLLQELARELRGDTHAEVRVGNKTLTLSPSSVLEYGIEVDERSPMLGGDREEVTVSLEWEVHAGDEA
ncbi:amphi-Trp domain-containing protein [Natrialba swarupiae]|uniref:Amphi-Trp domain-containing protein n=1 Tax=Natrialba swarupiae TaxID=2448032 RepID=A0A5D5ATB2_9EURY|nr:amphi-Trp domain-containing protein [Natrialba swarupiae]MCW8172586.1 amphi-Trp domain-containing protein [Natrialba swarupiae]TYT63112.1 amphi-Trp domain-containing protein [Natrialba swarupiae]